MSPDFEYFVDVDLARKVFLIRDFKTEAEVYTIPQYIMDLKTDPSEKAIIEKIRKLRWIDNDKLKVVNRSGLEKVVDIHQDFK